MKPELTPKLKTGHAKVAELPMLQILVCGFASKKGNIHEKKHDSAGVF